MLSRNAAVGRMSFSSVDESPVHALDQEYRANDEAMVSVSSTSEGRDVLRWLWSVSQPPKR